MENSQTIRVTPGSSDLVGEYVNIEDTATCRVGDAIEISADAHHVFMGEASFELQHRTIGDKG